MSRWYRAYEGTVTDAKLGEIALVAECSRSVVIAAWHALLEDCAAVNDGGRFETTPRRVAVILCEPVKTIEAVFSEMASLGMISAGYVTAWKSRQYESDNSTERSRKHREAKRNANATLQQRSATPPENRDIEDNYTGQCAREVLDKPEDLPQPALPDHKSLSRDLIKAGGDALANPAASPGLLVLSDPLNWMSNGCDLQTDILPAIRARCSRARPSSIRSWGYFTEAVFQARDNRLKPAPEPNLDRQNSPTRRSAPAYNNRSSGADVLLAAFARGAAEASGNDLARDDYSSGFDDGRTIDLVANRH